MVLDPRSVAVETRSFASGAGYKNALLLEHVTVSTALAKADLQLGLGILSCDSAVNQAVGVALWCVDFGILASVLQSLEPAEVWLSVLASRS